MRVLHVIPGLTPGGAESVLFRLVTYPTGVHHEIVCLEGRDWYSQKFEQHGIRVHHLNWRSRGAIEAVVKLHRLIRSSDADVIQAWMYRANLFAGISAKIARKPVVWNIRSTRFDLLPPATRTLAYVGGFLARWLADAVVNCSAASRRLHARIGYDAAPSIVVPNGYDVGSLHADERLSSNACEQLLCGSNCFVLATIGRWDRHKGYAVLLEAIRLLLDRGIALRLLFVGRGLDSSNPQLVQMIKESDCEHAVVLLGQVADIGEVDRTFDLHVLASMTEGFPNVVAETMLFGIPNVATDVGDAKLIVGDTGWVVRAGEARQLAVGIEAAYVEWANCPAQWAERRRAAHERIARNFPLTRMINEYTRIWAQVVQRAAHQAPKSHAPELGQSALSAESKPLRILHVINSMTLGGAETLLYRLVTRDSANHHVVVSLGKRAWYSPRLEESGVPLFHLNIDSYRATPRGLANLQRIIRQSDVDVVQCWMYRSNIVGGIVARLIGKPVSWSIHCSSIDLLSRSSRVVARMSGVLAPWVPGAIINCSSSSNATHQAIGYPQDKSIVIHNGYDPQEFYPQAAHRRATRHELGIGDDTFLVGTIARWDALKDIPNFLAAAEIAQNEGVPFQCLLVGAGLEPGNDELMKEIVQHRCGHFTRALGSRPDVQAIARALDLHVLASRTEAFPNVVAETMLSGTVNAVTDVGDSAIIVGDTGWTVSPKDPVQLASTIVSAYSEWKDHPDQWSLRCQAARNRIANSFSIEQMAGSYEQVWRSLSG